MSPDLAVKIKSKYPCVTVLPDSVNEYSQNAERVNMRLPMPLMRDGIKLTSLILSEARNKATVALREKGISFNTRDAKLENIEELIETLSDLEVDVGSNKVEMVNVFVE